MRIEPKARRAPRPPANALKLLTLSINPLFLPGVCFLLVFCALNLAAPADPGKREWTVWHTQCPVYSAPDAQGRDPLLTLKNGDRIEGLKYYCLADDAPEWIVFRHEGRLAYAPFAYLTFIPAENRQPGNLPVGRETVDRWNGLPHDYAPDDLAAIPGKYCYNPQEHQLRPAALAALIEMLEAAEKEQLIIRVVSSYRGASWQKARYLQKLQKEGLGQRVSAKPGHSEHQLGTTVDLAGSDSGQVLESGFGETKEGVWLSENCARFGFVISYTELNQDETGYIPEPWHLRFMGNAK